MALIILIITGGFMMVQSDSMTHYASYLYLGAENLSTDIFSLQSVIEVNPWG